MNKSLRWRALIILGVVALSAWAVYPPDQKVKLGLDLKGGVHLVLFDEVAALGLLETAADGPPKLFVVFGEALQQIRCELTGVASGLFCQPSDAGLGFLTQRNFHACSVLS